VTVVLLVALLNSTFDVSATELCGRASGAASERGAWLRNGWGVRVVIPSGNDSATVTRFTTDTMISQLTRLRTPRWIILNLTEPSFGGLYSAPHPDLSRLVDAGMTPSTDLLGYYIESLRAADYRIILYFAAQGPLLDFLSDDQRGELLEDRPTFFENVSRIEARWRKHLVALRQSHEQALANVISYYSGRYGTRIDGWWFDHGRWGDPILYPVAARAGNADAAVGWNGRHTLRKSISSQGDAGSVWLLTRANAEADYTDGHITPPRRKPPWWSGNELLLEQAESCKTIDGAHPHLFVPLQSTWRGGKELFPRQKAIDWTRRAVSAGAGITWAAALQAPEFTVPAVSKPSYDLLESIDQALLAGGATPRMGQAGN
jgi:hypothetical protein